MQAVKVMSLGLLSMLLWSFQALAEAGQSLTMDKVRHFQISIEKGLYGVWRRDAEVITLAQKANFYVSSTYASEAKEVDLAFGTLHNPLDKSERVNLGPETFPRFLRGVASIDEYRFFLDSGKRQFLIWNEKQKIWHQAADIVFDLVRPPSDPKGEAPQAEVDRLRQKVNKYYSISRGDPELIAGFAPAPLAWQKKDGSQFILLLRLPVAALLTVRCEGRHYSRCQAQRACFLKGLTDQEIKQAAGLSVWQSKGEIWVGLPKSRQIRRLSAQSCLEVRSLGNLALADDFGSLSNLYFDGEESLWLTLSEPHRSNDGSLFRWDAKVLESLLNR